MVSKSADAMVAKPIAGRTTVAILMRRMTPMPKTSRPGTAESEFITRGRLGKAAASGGPGTWLADTGSAGASGQSGGGAIDKIPGDLGEPDISGLGRTAQNLKGLISGQVLGADNAAHGLVDDPAAGQRLLQSVGQGDIRAVAEGPSDGHARQSDDLGDVLATDDQRQGIDGGHPVGQGALRIPVPPVLLREIVRDDDGRPSSTFHSRANHPVLVRQGFSGYLLRLRN